VGDVGQACVFGRLWRLRLRYFVHCGGCDGSNCQDQWLLSAPNPYHTWSHAIEFPIRQTASLPFAAALNHVFNHGAHHRGQITAALTMLGQPCPELDLVRMLQKDSSK
jgi:uncharacterized damage-inducible protein DinB